MLDGIDATLDHTAIAVRSITGALPLVRDALGGSFLFAGDQRDQGFRFAQFRLPGGGKIELVTPLRDDSFLARFLAQRGEGVHHITLKVPDIARSIRHLEARGIPLTNVSIERPDWKEAFIHPRDAHGVLIQLAESPWADEDMARHHLDDHGDEDHRHLTLEEIEAESREKAREPAGS